jgi:predicted dehydrogenase
VAVESPGVGLLGYAFMGRAHAHALLTIGHMTGPPPIAPRLVAVAGRDETQRAEFAGRFGFARHVADWEEVVADPEVEVLENLLPNHLHAVPTIAAARAGKHVLCEKPLALDATQARTMLDAVLETDVLHMCAFNYRFVPAVRRAREMLEAGELGDVHHFRAAYRQSWGADPERVGVWRFDATQAGGGALGDLASHVVDLARYLVGEIEAVAAEVATFVPGRTFDDAVAAVVTFVDGAVGTIEATRFATGELNRFTWEINGSEGSLAFDLERLNELVINGKRTLVNPEGWWPPGHVLGWEHTFVFELRRFLDAVGGRGTVGPHGATFEDGVRACEVCDAILLSAREGRRVQPGA